MDKITEKDFRHAKDLPPLESELDKPKVESLTDKEFQDILEKMNNPVMAQKEIAVQVKHFLDNRIKDEMRTKGILSDHTRRWVEAFNVILEKIQKALYGEKSVSFNVHKISHSDIASKIREVTYEIKDEPNKQTKDSSDSDEGDD